MNIMNKLIDGFCFFISFMVITYGNHKILQTIVLSSLNENIKIGIFYYIICCYLILLYKIFNSFFPQKISIKINKQSYIDKYNIINNKLIYTKYKRFCTNRIL